MQQAEFFMLRQFLQHARHRCRNRQPLMLEKEMIDAHHDQEDYEISFNLRSKPAIGMAPHPL